MAKLIDLTGKVYGRLTVVERGEDTWTGSGDLRVTWRCSCSCGDTVEVVARYLRRGTKTSCGACYGSTEHLRVKLDIAIKALEGCDSARAAAALEDIRS